MKKTKLLFLVIVLLLIPIFALGIPNALAADNNITIKIDGNIQHLNQSPIIINETTLVPFMEIREALSATIIWDKSLNSVTIKTKDTQIQLTSGSNKAVINEKEQLNLPEAPQLIEDNMMVPLRSISEALGALVVWDDRAKTIEITTGYENSLTDLSVPKQEFDYYVEKDPDLHPHHSFNGQNLEIMNNIYEGLFRLGPNNEYQLALAKNYKISEDGLTWTFTIRDANWDDGEPITADDFVYGIQTASSYSYNNYLINETVKYVYATDKKTLVFRLFHIVPDFRDLLIQPVYFPVKKGSMDQDYEIYGQDSINLNYNGPFKITSWIHDKEMILEKNEQYWDANNVNLEKVKIYITKGTIELYQKGKIDLLKIDANQLDDYRYNEDYANQLTGFVKPVSHYLLFNLENPILQNINIRKAITYGFNRENYLKRLSIPATSAYGYVPSTVAGKNQTNFRDENSNLIENNPKKALDYLNKGLSELGLKKLPPLRFVTNKGDIKPLVEGFKDTGIKIEGIQVQNINDKYERIGNGEFDIILAERIDYSTDPLPFLSLFEGGNDYNYYSWNNWRYNQLVRASENSTNQNDRIDNLLEAERILVQDQASIVPAYFDMEYFLINPQLKNYVRHNSREYGSWKWIYFE